MFLEGGRVLLAPGGMLVHMFLHFMQNAFHSAVGGVLSLRRPAGAFGGIRTNTARGTQARITPMTRPNT